MDNYNSNNRNSNSGIISIILIGIIVVIGLFAFNIIPNPISSNSKEIAFTKKEIRLQKNDSIQLSLTNKSNNIKYKSSDEKIVTINEDTGYIKGIKNGTVTITAYDGDKVIDTCTVEVYTPGEFINISSIKLSETKLNLYVGNSKQLKVTISPNNATEKKIIWSTSNKDVATIDKDGNVTGIGVGTAIIKVRTENGVSATCEVNVSKKNENAKPTEPTNSTSNEPTNSSSNEPTNSSSNEPTNSIPNKSTKTQIKKVIISKSKISVDVGKTTKISYRIEPTNGDVSSVKWTSSNTSIATVTKDGIVKGIKKGNAYITLTINGTISGKISVTVNKEEQKFSSKVWAYSDDKVITPAKADLDFFTKLANKGIGSISGNIYSYSGYKYYTKTSNLVYNGRSSLVRIYYPKNTNLRNVNTFTFFGGSGEINMKGFFDEVDSDGGTKLIKSSGIIILVSTSKSFYDYQDALNATNFVKAITKQKDGKKNSIGGYSLGGPAASDAMVKGKYDRLFIIHSRIDPKNVVDLKNKTIYFYSPVDDTQLENTKESLKSLNDNGAGKNITVVTNNSSLVKTYGDIFTIVNPGSKQGSGHDWVNFTNGNLFAFACSD